MKKILKALAGAWRRFAAKRSAAKQAREAFRYDRKRFTAFAGALGGAGGRAAAIAEIVMGYHVIEKGLTMPRRRLGFGQWAAKELAEKVEAFERAHGPGELQVRHAAGVLRAYRELHRDWPEPLPWLDEFLSRHPDVPAAVEPHVRREAFFASKDAPFPVFAASRHSVRHFAGPVPEEKLRAALEVACTAPSACNRQGARVRVIRDPERMASLLALQGGTRGFGADAGAVLVVTYDLATVRWAWERHDAWVNGGIFAATLFGALHHQGVAHCPLHWSVAPDTDRKARALLGLGEGEVVVLLVACGMPPEEFDVAASPRRTAEEVATWDS